MRNKFAYAKCGSDRIEKHTREYKKPLKETKRGLVMTKAEIDLTQESRIIREKYTMEC